MTVQFQHADDVLDILNNLPQACDTSMKAASDRQGQLTKPPGSLGRLEDLAIWLAGWQGREKPEIRHPRCVIFAGNHGITAKGVSAFPPEVTMQMVANFKAGGAAINQLCQAAGAELDVHALDLDRPTADFTEGPAMTIEDTLAAMQRGADAIPDDADLLMPGEMGIGNTTSAAALALAVMGNTSDRTAIYWTGPGTGLDQAGVTQKAAMVQKAIDRNKGKTLNPVELLSEYGGREVAAIAGLVLAARMRRIPVLLDGYISTAACLPLWHGNASALAHCQISHCSKEPGHQHILAGLGLQAILDLGMRLGEGSGAATALPIVKAALAAHNGMATFAEAGVSGA